ncbi:MAG: iron-containing alcohol dehydrogenase family protein [Peptoniphilus sp.]|nr:iron-containing alcohol dehydrogenase family protein [Peptoniphilus sp.]MDD7363153.1 iron-containing alcohol dehydrogenase family protein [Bacillota bacterium]MDY6044523.1 iron-containing alcohol dehydrogenase family protein [Peptoniphilus sp.]
MYMPNYYVSDDGYPDLADVLKDKGYKKVVLIGGKRALAAAAPKIKDALRDTDIEITGEFIYGTECTEKNIRRLTEEPAVLDADVLFGIGGGKALDTTKVTSLEIDKPAFSFPTICSNCAAMTAIAVVYREDGGVLRYAFPKSPSDIFIDLSIIAEAPDIYFWAGIGDGISKQPEVLFASKGDDLDHMARLGVGIAKTCEEPLLTYGEAGLEDVKNNRVSRAVEEVALTILVSTGYVSNLTNQDDYYYNSSLAHVFFDSSCVIKREGDYLHGEVVAFGVMVLHAYAGDDEELDKIARFNRSLGLPTTLDAIGLEEKDLDTMMQFVPETIEYQRSSQVISIRRLKEAILKADAYGKTLTN